MKAKGAGWVLAVLLTLCMTFGAAPVAVHAAVSPEVEYSSDGGVTWTDQDLLANAIFNCYLNENSIIRLKRDITLDGSWQLPIAVFDNHTVTLDGAGHTIYRGSATGGFLLLSQANSHLILKNITLDGGAVWSDPADVTGRTNSGKSQGGNCQFFYLKDHTALTLDSGTVLQNNHLNGKVNGAAIWLEGGTLTVKDGAKIVDNAATGVGDYGGAGGAVQVDGGAAFYMEGGEISGNYASVAGGAVFVEDGGVFELTGGAITGNAAGNNSGAVGGQTGYQIKLTGGTISGNRAAVGGALLPWDAVTVGGGIRITGNRTLAGKENNVHLYSPEHFLTISGALTGQARIGITSETLPVEDAAVRLAQAGNGYAITVADRTKFYHDGGDYQIALQNGLLQMQLAKYVGYEVSGGTTVNVPYDEDHEAMKRAIQSVIEAGGNTLKIKKENGSYSDECALSEAMSGATYPDSYTDNSRTDVSVRVNVSCFGENTKYYPDWESAENPGEPAEEFTIHFTVVIGTPDAQSGNIQKEVEQGVNVPNTQLSMSTGELADAVLTEQEKQLAEGGTDIRILLTVRDAADMVSAEDQNAVRAALNRFSEGQYLDINLLKYIDGAENRITETTGLIKIKIAIPDGLKNTDGAKNREFAVIRVHRGEATVLEDLDADADTITFETDRFSTYALVYRDTDGHGGAGETPATGGRAGGTAYWLSALLAAGALALLAAEMRKRGKAA